MEAVPKRLPNWAIWLACVAPLLGFWTYGLFDLDEGFYGAVVVDMIRRHDWITPTLNGVPWFEKPILAYWLAMPSVQLFGESWGPRLPSVLCTLATIAVLYRFASRHFDIGVARLAALVYATNLLVVGIGRMMMTDAPLVLCLTLAMTKLADWRLRAVLPLPGSSRESSSPTRSPEGEGFEPGLPVKPMFQPGWSEWCWIGLFVGLGILAKGPVALILFGATFLFASFLVPAFRGAWKSAWPIGLLVAGAVLATWYVPCYTANGQDFFQKFLIEQNFGRFAGGDRAHAVPDWALWVHPIYFPAVLLLSFLPWILFSGKNLLFPRQPDQTESKSNTKILWIWALVPIVFFSISGTKLPHYILPAVPPLAVLVSATLLRVRKDWRWESVGLAWSASLFVVAQYTMMSVWHGKMKEVQDVAKFVRTQGGRLVVYKLGGNGEAAGPLGLRETSHPSLLYYYRGLAVVTDDPDEVAKTPAPYYVLTGAETAQTDPAVREFNSVSALQKGGFYILSSQNRVNVPGTRKYVLLLFERSKINTIAR